MYFESTHPDANGTLETRRRNPCSLWRKVASFPGKLAKTPIGLFQEFRRSMQVSRAEMHLLELPDNLLEDIGLSRQDLNQWICHPPSTLRKKGRRKRKDRSPDVSGHRDLLPSAK